ncbi:MAG: NAD(P)/FAD-dependent oxidoreductase [Candidatus Competibacteraceae bacterium]
MDNKPTLIIGAGPAGLTAAYELGRQCATAVILDSSTDMGGLSRTVSYRGFRFDIGGHRFFSKIPAINALWRQMLGDEFLERPRLSRIYYRDHFFDYPLRPLNALAGLGVLEAVRVVASYAYTHWPGNRPPVRSFEDWVSRRFGKRLFEIFFKTYTEKVWGIPCDQIAADWAAQRIKDLSLWKAVKNALTGQNHGEGGQLVASLIERFHYPRLGPGMMWERFREAVEAQGNAVVTGVRVGTIRHRRGRVECVYGRGLDGEHAEFDGGRFISSMALRALILALDPPPPDDVLRAAAGLAYRDFLSVVLIVDRAEVFPDNWIYVHSPTVKMGRIQNYKNWSPDMVPDPSMTALGLEYFLWDADPEWHWPDAQLIELGIRECAALGLIRPGEIRDATVVRAEKAYPVYDHDYQRRLQIIRDYLAHFENLQTIGRNGLHRYNNQDHSMLTGLYAAQNSLGGPHQDVWSVNTEQSYQEEAEPRSNGLYGDRLTPVTPRD